jgi:demethylmenaquinone methyltransferase/2-methoxy-6-polyprenyl-1,4-benzoquinol methylase
MQTPQNPANIEAEEVELSPEHADPEGPEPSREGVWRMFDRIAGRYDLLNRLLSGRRDVYWRSRLADRMPEGSSLRVLDLATGTADVLLSLAGRRDMLGLGVGVDMASAMLAIGRDKIARRHESRRLHLVRGDAMTISFGDGSFDAVTISFGIRNVTNLDKALAEMRRVLRPGGRALVLEFSLPRAAWVRSGYLWYLRHILPRLGALISGDAHAYRYLNQTIETFPYGEAFVQRMCRAGYTAVKAYPMTFGIVTLYEGEQPALR